MEWSEELFEAFDGAFEVVPPPADKVEFLRQFFNEVALIAAAQILYEEPVYCTPVSRATNDLLARNGMVLFNGKRWGTATAQLHQFLESHAEAVVQEFGPRVKARFEA